MTARQRHGLVLALLAIFLMLAVIRFGDTTVASIVTACAVLFMVFGIHSAWGDV